LIIYLDEDNSYLSWINHHRDGFVIEWLRTPTRRHPIIHRATCAKIRVAKSKKSHWTTGRRLKACSLDLEKLVAWADQESGDPPHYCAECAPRSAPAGEDKTAVTHLTRMEKEILDYVLEISVYHLDYPQTQYGLTVEDIGDCLDKTTGQIATALLRLIEIGYLQLEIETAQKEDIQGGSRVFPTVRALRMEPAFEKQSDQEIETELAGLRLK
jgi:hypothetical protein